MDFDASFTDTTARAQIKRAMNLLGAQEKEIVEKGIDILSVFDPEASKRDSRKPEDNSIALLHLLEKGPKGEFAISPKWAIEISEKKLAYQLALIAHTLCIAKKNLSAENAWELAKEECSDLWRQLLA